MHRVTRFLGTLRTRMSLTLTAVLSVLVVLAAVLFARHSAHVQLDTQQRLIHSIAASLTPALERLLLSESPELATYLSRVGNEPAVAAVRLTDARGQLRFSHVNDPQPPTRLTRLLIGDETRAQPLRSEIATDGVRLGTLEIAPSFAPINNYLQRLVTASLAGGGGVIVLILALAYVILSRVSKPLQSLAQWAHDFARGRNTRAIAPGRVRYREIDDLNRAFADGSAVMRHYLQSLAETKDLLEHSELRLRKLINGMHEILFELDPDGRISFLNPAWESLTGFRVEDALGKPFTDFLLAEDVKREFHPSRMSGLCQKSRETTVRTASGRQLWVSLDAEAQTDSGGYFTGVVGTLGDVTRSVELNRMLGHYQDELYQLSVTDPLTGLYNRRHFDSQLEEILSEHLTQRRSVCLLLIDLDGFKFINDTYGHPLGDEVLRTMAQLLKQQVRRNDYIARLAGDEFAMVLKNTTLAIATQIARKLHARISETRVTLPVGYMQLQASIGVAEAPTHGRNAQELVSAADVALYHSKRHGRNRIEALSPDTSRAMMSIFSQGFQLRNALEQGHINPAFQPIFDMQNSRPVAYEVLARMRVKDGIVQAKDFIALAEELGLTRDVDLHIIRQALLATPREQALFLNVDLGSFNDPAFVEELAELLEPACRAGRAITIEITEREWLPLSATLDRDIQRLRGIGCKLALDDFGSGYSTYEFLNRFRPDYIKIEGSFVRGMVDNDSDHKIVRHIHELATSFGMQTIAECVENEATERALQQIGIRNAQGLFYGAPVFPA